MIISHKNKFIFFKPMKVAGSSVEAALSRHCSDDDILTGTNHIDEISSSDYEYPTRNNIVRHTHKGDVAIEIMKKSGNIHKVTPEMIKSGLRVEILEPKFHMHALPEQVLDLMSIGSEYKKVTIVRNPWDMIVSFFWWSFYPSQSGYIDSNGVAHKGDGDLGFTPSSHPEAAPTLLDSAETLRQKLEIFCQLRGDFRGPFGLEKNRNVLDWFVDINKKYYQEDYDYILRYENLQPDYDKFCKDINIPTSTLPRLKSSQRKIKMPYQNYFNEWTISHIADKLSMWEEKFGYIFD